MYPGVHAAEEPERPALIMAGTGEVLTYGDLDRRSLRLANALRAAGHGPGDVVALLASNTLEAFEVYWAAIRSGMYLCAVNWHLQPSEISYIINDSGASALVVSADLRELAEGFREEIPKVRTRLCYGGSISGFDDYENVIAEASDELPESQPRGIDMLYSSGTTGRPKGVKPALPDLQVDEPGDLLTELLRGCYGFGKETTYLSPAPVYHAAPLRYCAAVQAVGGTVVLMEKFDPEAALRAIERYRITHSQWVPTMFVRMLKLPEQVRNSYDFSSHRKAIHAAAPCPIDVKQAMIDWWGPILYEYYASTEAIGMTMIDSEQWLRKRGSVGKPVLGTVRICDDDGQELPPGQVGTVYFERDEITFEYHGDPEKTKESRHPEHPNWATVGDLGYVDEDGFLFLTDRKAFMIISGGVNIYPQEVENVLTMHPDVLDVAVIGVPDPEMGEAVKAVVQPMPGAQPGPELERKLIEYVRERIAHYKAPRSVDFVTELPRKPTGKLFKEKLKERYLKA